MENNTCDYSKYKKTVILLEEENSNFANRDEYKIYGDLKIETGNEKGAMSLVVKNLRLFERNKYIYKLILFGKKKERTIYAVIGTLTLNRYGEGENYYRFSPLNIDGKGNDLKDFSVAIIAAVSMRDDKEPLHPVLKGSLIPSLSEDTKNTNSKPKTFNHYYSLFLKEHCSNLENMCENINVIQPFAQDITKVQWRRMSGLNGFPIVSPGAQLNVKRYGHYLFGHDNTFFFFAIPGRFIDEEHPDSGSSGFTLWQPIRGAEGLDANKEGCPLETRMAAYGYWILAVKKSSGEIIEIPFSS